MFLSDLLNNISQITSICDKKYIMISSDTLSPDSLRALLLLLHFDVSWINYLASMIQTSLLLLCKTSYFTAN